MLVLILRSACARASARSNARARVSKDEDARAARFGQTKSLEESTCSCGNRSAARCHCFRVVIYNGWRNSNVSRAIARPRRSEEHTSELQSLRHLVCRLLLEKKKNKTI